jgi:thiosulfate dehydrogenase
VKSFLLGLVIGIVILPVFAFIYVFLGYAPVATTSSPLPLERTLANLALNARIKREAPKQSTIPANEQNLLAGAEIYRDDCAACHGIAGQPPTAIAAGMFPKPPQLFRGKGVTDDPPGETFWKAANGIRLTGMPAFRNSLSDLQLWQVSLLLVNADKLPPSVSAVVWRPISEH